MLNAAPVRAQCTGLHERVIFSDYPEDNQPSELSSEIAELPSELESDGQGLRVSGQNTSDDLKMMLVRKLDTSDGIEPGQTYRIDFSVTFASDAQSDCLGIGGAPGESVFLRMGATPYQPQTVVREEAVRVNVDAGNQAAGGIAASAAGNVANGIPCGSSNDGFVSLDRDSEHVFPVTASSEGELWLIVLTDSGFEGESTLFYQEIAATLTPVPLAAKRSFANLSSLGSVSTGNPVIGGFVIEQGGGTELLLRAVGPGLESEGVENFLGDPVLRVFDSQGNLILENENWEEGNDVTAIREAEEVLGAFPLADGSLDATLLTDLNPGVYTAMAMSGSESEAMGQTLVEIYNSGTENDQLEFLNLSTRAEILEDGEQLVYGFVIKGELPKRVLLRAVGPSLQSYLPEGTRAAEDTMMQLYREQTLIAENDPWMEGPDTAAIRSAATQTGAFPLMENSEDAAMLANLNPGIYTVRISNTGTGDGVVLAEGYFVAPDEE